MSQEQILKCSRELRKMDVERFVSELLELILLNLKREKSGEEEMRSEVCQLCTESIVIGSSGSVKETPHFPITHTR